MIESIIKIFYIICATCTIIAIFELLFDYINSFRNRKK